jgi:hypothetical protein
MNTKIISLILIIFTLSSCKTILISEKKVPTEKICGAQAKYECRATGFGSNNLTFRIFKKERPNVTGKGKFAGLGRGADVNPENFHNTYKIIELDSSEVTIEKTKIDYDLKKDNVTKILVDLNAELKEQKINAEARLQIKNDFEKQLNSFLKIEAYIETYTLSDLIQDKLRDAKNGTETEKRYVDAYNLLKNSNTPLIRQVIVIREICNFKENKNIKNILEPILKAEIGEGDAKANAVLSGTLKRDKTENFSTNYDKTTIYSYGYFSDNWMYK